MISIDGAYGEGGGQILRTAISLSALTMQPVKIFNIRASRTPKGLKPQHKKAIEVVAELCDAETTGVTLGSEEITFVPKKISSKTITADIGTAGSVTLVLQALMPAALLSQKEFIFNITGGTNVTQSPPIEYFKYTFCELLKKYGAKIEVSIGKYGFYPRGGGEVTVNIQPSKIEPIKITERGKFIWCSIYSIASKTLESARVAQRQASALQTRFSKNTFKKETKYVDSLSDGSSIHACFNFENTLIGAETLGTRGISSEIVGKNCAKILNEEINSNSTVDEFMADQLIPFIAFFGGEFRTRKLSLHAKTNIWVTEHFFGKVFKIEGNVVKCMK